MRLELILNSIKDGHEFQVYRNGQWKDLTMEELALELQSGNEHNLRVASLIRTLTVDLPMPYKKAPPEGTQYFVPDFVDDDTDSCFYQRTWYNDESDSVSLSRGVAFKTEQDAIAFVKAFSLKG